jgi:hypothetical protein
MLNEQLTCLTPFSQIDWPGLAWQTEVHKNRMYSSLPHFSFVFFVIFAVSIGT